MSELVRSTRRAGRPRKGDERERSILRVTEDLLASVPLERLTVEMIASGVGISRASLYFYFSSKEQVVTALARQTIEVLTAAARSVPDDPEADPMRTALRSIERTERLWAEHGPLLRVVRQHAPSVESLGDLWTAAMEVEVLFAERVLRRAGLPTRGPGSAKAMADLLCNMTADAFARVPATDNSRRDLRRTAKTVAVVWQQIVASAVLEAEAPGGR